ncbi:hypothetical protein P8881_19745 [Bacillus haynesii]|uniref:hypothetical protein n=1 Tax=Bacillus haynesii TaxID=1925021 RepID=UPI0022811365|nr:hypothetical protein [Bacillus haynesii]MCY8737568.1 hypothetical protein [Bacillus haynesii]MEC0709761.1 hypothetical protein [Bacillus haynesii]MEC0736860.1 hypothetical protein [Bacillus haynesii]
MKTQVKEENLIEIHRNLENALAVVKDLKYPELKDDLSVAVDMMDRAIHMKMDVKEEDLLDVKHTLKNSLEFLKDHGPSQKLTDDLSSSVQMVDRLIKPDQVLSEKGFYIEDLIRSSDTKIHTEEQLRSALLDHAEKKQSMEYEGWDPDDYTSENIQEFDNKWIEKTEKLREGSVDDLIKYITDERINLTAVKPSELTAEDFEDDNNPKFLNVTNVINGLENKDENNILSQQDTEAKNENIDSNILDSIEKRFVEIEKMLKGIEVSIQESGQKGFNTKENLEKLLEQLKALVTKYVNQLKSSLEGKVDHVKTEANNLIASKVQNINQKIKDLSETIDKNFPLKNDQQNSKEMTKTKSADKTNDISGKTDRQEPDEKKMENKPLDNKGLQRQGKIEKENEGLKTFIKVLKEKYPNEFNDVIKSMNQKTQSVNKTIDSSENDQPLKKPVIEETKVKEVLEL